MVQEYGAFGLFVLAFLAATILPFSSEAAFLAALYGGMSQGLALTVASLGNTLAVVLNYFLGYWFRKHFDSKLRASKSGQKAFDFSEKYGLWFLWLSPLPIIGDPITIVAGISRLNFKIFIVIAGGLRIARYLFILYLFRLAQN